MATASHVELRIYLGKMKVVDFQTEFVKANQKSFPELDAKLSGIVQKVATNALKYFSMGAFYQMLEKAFQNPDRIIDKAFFEREVESLDIQDEILVDIAEVFFVMTEKFQDECYTNGALGMIERMNNEALRNEYRLKFREVCFTPVKELCR